MEIEVATGETLNNGVIYNLGLAFIALVETEKGIQRCEIQYGRSTTTEQVVNDLKKSFPELTIQKIIQL